MTTKLFESNFITIDLSPIINNTQNSASKAETGANTTAKKSDTNSDVNLKETLVRKIEDTIKVSKTEAQTLADKLMSLGDPFKNALIRLGFNIDLNGSGKRNPLLAFVLQEHVRTKLLNTGFINISTFKALYQAVANSLVADRQFFEVNDYNIIYCADLYRKSLGEILQYLMLQKTILKPSEDNYSDSDKIKNKKVFFHIKDLSETGLEKRAGDVKNYSTKDSRDLPMAATATLNSLELAKLIADKWSIARAVPIDNKGQEVVINKLTDNNAKIPLANAYAAILSLVINTNSEEAKKAIQDARFKNITGQEMMTATIALSNDSVLPKGQIRTSDADALVAKIMASL